MINIARIRKLIDKKGKDITLSINIQSGPDYNPTLTPSNTPARAMPFDSGQNILADNNIPRGLSEYVFSVDTEVTANHKIIDDGKTFEIMDLEEVSLTGDKLMYVALVKL